MDSNIGTSSARDINSPNNTSLPLTHKSSHDTLKRQITDQLVAPSNVLNYKRPVKRQKPEQLLVSQGMDKRHPSSFQQLEKVFNITLEVKWLHAD